MAHLSGDNYVHRGMQTFNEIHKNKEIQCLSSRSVNVEIQADSWDIHDSQETSQAVATPVPDNAMCVLISLISLFIAFY